MMLLIVLAIVAIAGFAADYFCHWDDQRRCPTCRGTAVIGTESSVRPCEDCHGTGRRAVGTSCSESSSALYPSADAVARDKVLPQAPHCAHTCKLCKELDARLRALAQENQALKQELAAVTEARRLDNGMAERALAEYSISLDDARASRSTLIAALRELTTQSVSTRQIEADDNRKRYGHNPSWVKVADLEKLL